MAEKLSKIFKGLSEKITYRHWVMLAGVASVFLGLLVFFSLNSEDPAPKEEVVDVHGVRVVVAKQDIAPKTVLRESMLEVRDVPAYLVPSDAVNDLSEIVNKPASVQIMKDDIVSTRKVLMDISMAGFTGTIPPECRAVSVGISDLTGVAGFAQPGDYVDVMIVGKGNNKMVGRIVLQDVQLLAINKSQDSQKTTRLQGGSSSESTGVSVQSSGDFGEVDTVQTEETRAIDNPAIATLALTPSDALKLITEAQDGTIYLTLRPYKPRDKFTTSTTYVHYSTINDEVERNRNVSPDMPPQGASAPAANAAAPAAAPANVGSVEVIRGTAMSREG